MIIERIGRKINEGGFSSINEVLDQEGDVDINTIFKITPVGVVNHPNIDVPFSDYHIDRLQVNGAPIAINRSGVPISVRNAPVFEFYNPRRVLHRSRGIARYVVTAPLGEPRYFSALPRRINGPSVQTPRDIPILYSAQKFRRVHGGNLRDALELNPLSLTPGTKEIAIAIASALNASHGANVAHGDVRAENILLEPPHVGLCDWGTSRRDSDPNKFPPKLKIVEESRAGAGFITGAPNYLSLQMLGGNREAVIPGDWYAFGITLYEMIMGEHPYERMYESVTAVSIYLAGDFKERTLPQRREEMFERGVPNALADNIIKLLKMEQVDYSSLIWSICELDCPPLSELTSSLRTRTHPSLAEVL